ncbi:MAG: phosphate ABC transporter substrate-binding protein [Phycisphaerae bacterium]|nr:phosphate ABC transporter substrate-binding protein [Phycisphaerae bacterium]
MKMLKIGLLLVFMVLAQSVSAETLQIDGSTTVGPIAEAFAEYFKSIYPDLEISVKKTGSGDGAKALGDGMCDIAAMSRFMKLNEFKKCADKGIMPVAHVVAMDGICIIVHPSNPVKALTTQQVQDIYLGKITNWSQVGGPNLAVVAVSRDTSSGTYETFHELVMKKKDIADKVEYVNANPQAHARVSGNRGAIAYVGLGFVDAKVKSLTIDGVVPSKRTIVSGVYPIARPLFLFTNGYPKLGSMVHRFVTFQLTEVGQELVEAKKFVPVTDY